MENAPKKPRASKRDDAELTPSEIEQRKAKAKREGESRDRQSLFLAHLQNAQLVCNPNLHQEALGKPLGNKRQGWKDLKSNNVNMFVAQAFHIKPLVVNKTCALRSGNLRILQSHELFNRMLAHLEQIDPAAAVEFAHQYSRIATPESNLNVVDPELFPWLLHEDE